MSSARNHRIRSHRSYKNRVSTAEHFQSRNFIKTTQKKAMNDKKNFFAKLMGLFKKGDK